MERGHPPFVGDPVPGATCSWHDLRPPSLRSALPGWPHHCIARRVRRAWLCGDDPYNGENYHHRRLWVEDRISVLADLFAVSVTSHAVMSRQRRGRRA